MSKESRRAARLARESRQAGGAGRPAQAGTTSTDPSAAGSPTGTSGSTGPAGSAGPAGSTGPGVRRPVAGTTTRAGRRDRVRPGPAPTFLERYRTAIVTIAAVAIVAVAVGYVFLGSTAAAYTCTQQFSPSPTAPLTPGSSDRLGFAEDDMGQTHILSTPVKYLYCPPASGGHFGNNQGVTGPIPARVYGPNDKAGPQNWIHNLEHGGLVVLYRNDSPGSTADGQQAFRTYFDSFPDSPVCKVPKGQLSPVIARFDDMPHAFAVLVWDRVFYMDTWDPALANQFYLTESERLDANGQLIAPPEKVACDPSARPTVGPSESAAPSGSVTPSVAPSAAPSSAPSAAASPEPSAAPS